MKVIKLTYQDGRTRPGEMGETQWGEGIVHTATGDASRDLCTNGWIHCYEGLGVALMMNCVHANIPLPIAWEAEGEIGKREGWKKSGCRRLTTVRQIEYLSPPTEALVGAVICCALAVYENAAFVIWAEGWLSGEDRSHAAAYAAACAAYAACAACAANAANAACAAYAADAACATANAACAAYAADAACATAYAANAAYPADIIESALLWWTNPPISD